MSWIHDQDRQLKRLPGHSWIARETGHIAACFYESYSIIFLEEDTQLS